MSLAWDRAIRPPAPGATVPWAGPETPKDGARDASQVPFIMTRMARRLPFPALRRGLSVVTCACAAACAAPGAAGRLNDAERAAIGDSVRAAFESAYTFDSGDVVQRFMRLYPDTGRVISAATGTFSTTRDSLRQALTTFWQGAGQYMQRPKWVWGPLAIDVLSDNAVAATARYTVPHWTPDGAPHVLGGAWTSVWTRRDGRWVIVQEHLSDMPRALAERLEAGMPRLSDTTRR